MSLETNKLTLIICASSLLLALGIFCIWFYIHTVQLQYVQHTKDALAVEEQKLISIANLTSNDRIDATVESIIIDCTIENRARFDQQLSILPQLKGLQLTEIEQLFYMCGDFYAQKKAVMVSRLQSQFEFFSTLVLLTSHIDTRVTPLTYKMSQWTEFVELQKKQSDLSLKLVDIQGAIILQLKKNTSINSNELQALVVDGQKTRDAVSAVSVEIETVQKQLQES